MIRRAFTLLLAVTLIVAFAGTIYYLYRKSEKPPVIFATESPKVSTIIKKTVATGSVVPRQEVAIKPQVSGILEKLFVEPGDLVERGDLIARIDIVPNMVALATAESRVKRARIGIDDTRRELERNRSLQEQGVVAEAALQQHEVAHDRAREELAAAIDNLELIRKGTTTKTRDASNTLVRATVAGTVLEVPLLAGSSVIEANTFNDGTTIATVADMGELIFKGKVDESEVGKIRAGMQLLLTIGAIEEEKFEATLERIAPKGVAENGAIQFEIRAALKNADGRFIRANLSANADIVLARKEGVLAIDEALLQFEDGKPFVEVETAPQQFEKRRIETGLSDGILIEVVSGIDAESRVKGAAKGPTG